MSQISLQQGAPTFPFTVSVDDISVVNETDGGAFYATDVAKRKSFDLNIVGCNVTDLETLKTLYDNNRDNAFNLWLDEDEVFSSDKNDWRLYVRFRSPISWRFVSKNNFDVTLQLQEAF